MSDVRETPYHAWDDSDAMEWQVHPNALPEWAREPHRHGPKQVELLSEAKVTGASVRGPL